MEETILRLEKVTKSFFGNNALTDIDFDLRASEIHCICGENGAGKSTLIKLLSGAYVPDSGLIAVDDSVYDSLSPRQAQALGIHVIYQENQLLVNMDIAENIFLGHEKLNRYGIIDRKTLYCDAQSILDTLDANLDAHALISDLSVAQVQYVKIAKALAYSPRILIFDEPTTMFNITDANKLLDTILALKKSGIGIIYISHKLPEIVSIADRISVLRDGVLISCRDNTTKSCTVEQITSDMIGRPLDTFYHRERVKTGNEVLEVRDLRTKPGGNCVSFVLHKGEVLGIAGMVGAGRTEIVEAIFGVAPKYGGTLYLNGKEITINSPQEAIGHGLCLITEDRQKTGVLLDMSIDQNITITALEKIGGLLLNKSEESREAGHIVKKVNLKALDYGTDARYLSGGNQQKLIVGKWIFRDAEILIFDEPTRGIDVNSKTEIYMLMEQLVKEGKSIIMISSDMPELISISDRIIVIKSGEIVGQLTGSDICEENVIALAL